MANSFGYKYKRVLFDQVQVQITYEIVILPVEYIQKKLSTCLCVRPVFWCLRLVITFPHRSCHKWRNTLFFNTRCWKKSIS